MKKNRSLQPRIPFRQRIILVLFGVSLCLVLLEIGLRLGGFAILSLQEHRNRASLKQKDTYRILCLGESTTVGQWPPFLGEILNQRNIGIKFSVIDKGVSGISTSFLLAALESNLEKYHPNIVVAMMGTNDGGDYILYEKPALSKTMLFIRSFRTYKLARLLWLHMVNKAKELGLYKLHIDKPPAQEHGSSLLNIMLEETNDQQDDSTKNEDVLKKALELNSGNDRAYVRFGLLYQNQGQLQQMEGIYKKALELNPGNDEAYIELGRLSRVQGKLQQAEEAYKKALELNPGNDETYAWLGNLFRDQGKFQQAEDAYKKALELNPGNDRACVELGRLYQNQGKFQQAEDAYKKALELNPGNDEAYIELGRLFRGQEKLQQAEDTYKKALELNPGNDEVYLGFGRLYQAQRKFQQAEECFKRSLELNPGNDEAYIELGRLSRVQGKLQQAEDTYKKALELNPGNDLAYVGLSKLSQAQGQFQQAEECFKKALELNPGNVGAYLGFGRLYRDQGQFQQAEDAYKKALELNLGKISSIELYGALGVTYEEMGESMLAEECYSKANQIRLSIYNPTTVYNYHKLKEILTQKGIKLVCVQYPMLNIEPLKKIFQSDIDGVFFVDNEKTFKEAVKEGSYKMYFRDMFGGEFGHCTDKGNRLLAENIANVILKEVFRK